MFLFLQKGKYDVSNFDPEFTLEAPQLSPVPQSDVNIDQSEFKGFSYTNPEFDHSQSNTAHYLKTMSTCLM